MVNRGNLLIDPARAAASASLLKTWFTLPTRPPAKVECGFLFNRSHMILILAVLALFFFPGSSLLSQENYARSPRDPGTLRHGKLPGPSTATRRQTLQEYLRVSLLAHFIEVNNHLYALTALRTNEGIVGMECNVGNEPHGGQIIGLRALPRHLPWRASSTLTSSPSGWGSPNPLDGCRSH